MRHLKSGRKLNRTASHKKALLRNMATSLIQHKRIHTTEAKAKELRPFVEKLITKAKTALAREQQGLLADGNTVDFHNRRIVAKDIKNKVVLQELFDSVAPVVAGRNGGYTRIIKTGFRKGDSGSTALIELVDWSNPQEGNTGSKKKNTSAPKPKAAPVAEETVEEEVAVEEVTEEVETPVEEEVKAEETAPTDEATTEESSEEATETDENKDA